MSNQEVGTALAETPSAAMMGFEGQSAGSLVQHEAGVAGVVAREEAEIKAAIILARQFPRDEAKAFTKIMNSASRPGFAEGALYSFPRGGTTIEGPSVKMAREMARCWGNIRFGMRIVSLDEKMVHVKGWALDVETNALAEHEDKFERLIQRKRNGTTQWVKPDERDLRELVGRRGAMCVRNALLQLMPPDVIDEVIRQSKATQKKAAAGEIEMDRETAIRHTVRAFSRFGVDTEMLEKYLGHSLHTVTADELAELRAIGASIRDGQSTVEDYFGAAAARTSNDLNAALAQDAPEEPEAAPEPPKRQPKALSDAEIEEIRGLMDSMDLDHREGSEIEAKISLPDPEWVRRRLQQLRIKAAKQAEAEGGSDE